MKRSLFFLGIVVILGLAMGLATSFATDDAATPTAPTWPSGDVAAVDGLEGDFGPINIVGGEVERIFRFTNPSSEPLVVRTAATSCMCTTAYITADAQGSEIQVGMHTPALDWDASIAPQESFTVRVVFDPLAHGPDAVGPIQRSVYVLTSAAPNEETTYPDPKKSGGSILEMRLEGNVLSREDFELLTANQKTYSKEAGDFSFDELEYDFGVLKQSSGIATHDFRFRYNGDQELAVVGTPASCACTTASLNTTTLSPGDEAVLTVQFDPNLHEEPEGRFYKTVSILTDPKLPQSPEVKLWAKIDLDLGPESYKLQEHND